MKAEYQELKIDITVSWPVKWLSPNSRAHWTRVSAAKKDYKAEAMWATRAAIHAREGLNSTLGLPWQSTAVRYIFRQPDRRHRDQDNLIGSMKAALDGVVAGGLILNDRFVQIQAPKLLTPPKKGETPGQMYRPGVTIEVTRG